MNTLKLEDWQPASNDAPTHQRIEKRAYELYLARGGQPGNEQDDWLRAERELTDALMADNFTNEGAPVAKENGSQGDAARPTKRSNTGGQKSASSHRH